MSASRITQTHQLAGAVLKYAIKTGKLTKNVAAEIDRGQDLPEAVEAEHVYLTHAQLLTLADAAGRFDVLTLVLGYCGLRLGEAAALRRRHVKNRQITVRASATTVAGSGRRRDRFDQDQAAAAGAGARAGLEAASGGLAAQG